MSGHNHYTSGTVRSRSDLTLTRFGWLALIALCVPATGALAQPTGEEISACVQKMNETFLRKGWVGITPEYADDGSIVVKHVFADSPAAKAGMREEDIVRGLDGHDRKSAPDKFMWRTTPCGQIRRSSSTSRDRALG